MAAAAFFFLSAASSFAADAAATDGNGAVSRPIAGPLNFSCTGKAPASIGWFDGLAPTEAADAWTMVGWFYPGKTPEPFTLLAGFGNGINMPGGERFFAVLPAGLEFWGGNVDVPAGENLAANRWQHLAASYDGLILRVYRDGKLAAEQAITLTRTAMQIKAGPPSPWKEGASFIGSVGAFTVWGTCLPPAQISSLSRQTPSEPHAFSAVSTMDGTALKLAHGDFSQRGLVDVQDPATWPGPVPKLESRRLPKRSAVPPITRPGPDGRVLLNAGWEMEDAGKLDTNDGSKISRPDYPATAWYDATVPGTVLTTLVQQGIYPDPLYGLNNLTIPLDLARRSWWYRTRFQPPADWKSRRLTLHFGGVNYHAEVWLNGRQVGKMTGAFTRGKFDVTDALRTDGAPNVLAVHIWPPPHTGGTQDESQIVGDGPNGGEECLDGPTFFCTEGWDWIPTIRDRCTGIWQDVALTANSGVTLGDPQVLTKLPDPDLSRAEVTANVPLNNETDRAVSVLLKGKIAGVAVELPVELPAHSVKTSVFSPAQFPGLVFDHPKLWWPNGYGEPALHDLDLQIVDRATGAESDRSHARFGMRTVSYEFNPQLIVKVNGVRIFCQGGNWGLDDALKRISRERIEPYFRLHRDAHVTMIRNWCGQSTEPVFYDLCDEYGLLVWNDFWVTSKGANAEPLDGALLLANASDTILRYRNHPSIAVWCGRNEGVPPAEINDGLAALIKEFDGDARIYEPSSNSGPHVLHSGPWSYLSALDYTKHKQGFSTELGINSVPTADAIRAMMPAGETWPLSPTWTYHDLHMFPHGPSLPYLNAISGGYGVSNNLEEFTRRAQMINYVNHRAMFEAWNKNLWNPSSGLLIWMSHPAWPSTIWQFYTQDYETYGAYFGVKKGCEPIHVQWNVDDDTVTVSNHGTNALPGAMVRIAVHTMDGKLLDEKSAVCAVAASASTLAGKVEWPEVTTSPVLFLKLTLRDAAGRLVSDNFYWHAKDHKAQSALQHLSAVGLDAVAKSATAGATIRTTVELANNSPGVALMTHLVLRNVRDGSRILPAYASDNYISLLPGEKRAVEIECAAVYGATGIKVSVDGWNIVPAELMP